MHKPPAEAAPTPPSRHVDLDLELGSDPISGHISAAGARRSFTGWIELPGAIADATSSAGATVSSYPVGGSDGGSRLQSVTCKPPTPHTFAPGDTAVSCTATDIAAPVPGVRHTTRANTTTGGI